MKHLKNLLKMLAIVCAVSGCRLASSPIVRQHPVPDVDLCSMGVPRGSSNPGSIWIDCTPWFYEGRADYEVLPIDAARRKYFLIAPNHFRQLQVWIETVTRELQKNR